jgi:hypothetical protein
MVLPDTGVLMHFTFKLGMVVVFWFIVKNSSIAKLDHFCIEIPGGCTYPHYIN